nr:hypothetical protein [Streptomyces sp. I05A-00742]
MLQVVNGDQQRSHTRQAHQCCMQLRQHTCVLGMNALGIRGRDACEQDSVLDDLLHLHDIIGRQRHIVRELVRDPERNRAFGR